LSDIGPLPVARCLDWGDRPESHRL